MAKWSAGQHRVAVASVPGSLLKNGGKRECGSIRRESCWLPVPESGDYFVGTYLCCCANTQIVDSKMNIQGRILLKGWQKAVDRCAREALVWARCLLWVVCGTSSLIVCRLLWDRRFARGAVRICLRGVSDLNEVPWKPRAIVWIACDRLVSHATLTSKVGVSFMNDIDDAPEVDTFSRKCYQALLPCFLGESLGLRLGWLCGQVKCWSAQGGCVAKWLT